MKSVRMNQWKIILETAELIDVIEGKEDVERMDTLLSCAFVDDESWI